MVLTLDEEASEIIEQVVKSICWAKKPFFITGTKMAANKEWRIASNDLNKRTPLIWLLEVIDETGYGLESSIERTINARLFFLDQTDGKQYYTKEHRQKVVKPMQSLMVAFLNAVNESGDFKPIEKYRFKTFSRFGEENKDGIIKMILDADLSGVALDIELSRFRKLNNCSTF
jgi:hypothetical protein